MASQLEHYLPPTNLNRCRIRTSYRHKEPSQEGFVSYTELNSNIPGHNSHRTPPPHRLTTKDMQILLQQPHENSVVGDYNFKTRRHKGIIKNGSVKTKKHVTINLSNDETLAEPQNFIKDKPNFSRTQEEVQDSLNSPKYMEFNDDINMQYMEFAKLIKLKEDNVLLKEETLALKAALTQKDMEIDKYKEIIKKLLRKSDLSSKDNHELITGLIKTLNGDKTRHPLAQNKGSNIPPINEGIEKGAQNEFVNRMSERVRLKRLTMHKKHETVITGADIIQGVKNPAIVKHLMQPLVAKAEWNNAYKTSYCILSDIPDKSELLKNISEISSNLDNINMASEIKFVEEEYLKSKCERLGSQVEVLQQNLSESKQTADDLALKLSRSEGNLNSYQRMYHVTHQTNIILEVLLALKESQLAYSTAIATETNKESAYNSCETCSEEIGFYRGEEPLDRRPPYNTVPYLDILHHKMKSEQMATALLNLVEHRYAKVLHGQTMENGQANYEKSNSKIPLSPQSYAFNSLSSRGSSSTGNSSGHDYSSLENSTTAAKTQKSFSRDNEKRLKTFLRLLKIREKHLQKHSATQPEEQATNVNTDKDDQESIFNAFYAQYFAERYGAGEVKNNADLSFGSAEDLIFKSLDIQKFIDNLILPMRDQILMPKSSSYHIYEDPSKCLNEMENTDSQDAQQLALENSIILLELFEIKEQMAKLKVQKYHEEKEKNLAEIRLAIKHNMESSLKSQVQSLANELDETRKDLVLKNRTNNDKQFLNETEENLGQNENLKQSLMREYRLRKQIEELMGVVENISANSEKRYQNAMDVISELKYNNMFLNGKCDKIKRIYEARIKGFEPESGSSENEPLQSDDMNNEETDL